MSKAVIVISPTDRWIRDAFASSRKTIRISSPYVGGYLRDRVMEVPDEISVALLTRTLIADFASKASDFNAVCSIAARTGGILSLNSLHAKVYIVDGRRALITSANATYSGMHRNAECGFEITRPKDISELLHLFGRAFGNATVMQPWSLSELEALRRPIEVLAASVKRFPAAPSVTEGPQRFELDRRTFDRLLEGFAGWLRLTLAGIVALNKASFTLQEVYDVCQPLVAVEFPENRHPRPKLRQQLQRLRDLGIIQFLGGGKYELLARRRG